MPRKPVVDQLFALDVRLDREIDALGDAFDGLTRTQARDWTRAAVRLVQGLPTKQGGLSPRATAKAAGVQHVLDTESHDALRYIAASLDRFAQVSKLTLRGIAIGRLDPRLDEQQLATLAAYRTLKLAEFSDLQRTLTGRMTSAVRKAVVSGQAPTELVFELSEIADEWPVKARTLYETAISEFASVVTAVTSGAAADRVYLCTGPIDTRIRLFCLGLVGRVFSRRAIDGLDNGQLPNSFLTRGGYHCRHQWRDVTNIPELAKLADTGKIATPAIAGRIAALRGLPRVRGRRAS